MGKIRKNETGFSPIEVILVLVIVGLMGVVGFMVYNNQNKTKPATVATRTSTPTATTQTKTTTPTTVPATNSQGDYLVIKEWGVEIPLTADVKDAYYTSLKDNTFSNPVYAIGIHSLTALDPNCAPENRSVSLILRQTIAQHDENTNKNDPLNYPVYTTKIGGSYYGYDRSRAACSNNQKANDLQIATFNSLEKAFSGLKAVN